MTTQLFSKTVDASVRETVAALAASIKAASDAAQRASGVTFTVDDQSAETREGFRRTINQSGGAPGQELFVRMVIDYNAMSDTATVTSTETGPGGPVTTEGTISSRPRGRSQVTIRGEISAQLAPRYSAHLNSVFRDVSSRAAGLVGH